MFLALITAAVAGDVRIDSAGSFVVVSVDGKLVGTTPIELPKVEAGEHEVGFWSSATDAEPAFTQSVHVPEVGAVFVTVDFVGQTVDVSNAQPDKRSEPVEAGPGRPVGRLVGAGGLTLGGLGLGAAAGLQYLTTREAYVRYLEVPSDDAAQSIWDEEIQPGKVRTAALGVAGAVALGAGVGLFVTTDVAVVPAPSGLLVAGRF